MSMWVPGGCGRDKIRFLLWFCGETADGKKIRCILQLKRGVKGMYMWPFVREEDRISGSVGHLSVQYYELQTKGRCCPFIKN